MKIKRDAEISKCGKYRYSLTRDWDEFDDNIYTCLFVMLNPSTADALKDDPTIRRCIGFARELGCNRLQVVNLYAYRTPSPKELWATGKPPNYKNIIGTHNDAYIADAADRAHHVICAWGAGNKFRNRADKVIDVLRINQGYWPTLCCLGPETKHGHPRHPLYLKKNVGLYEFA